jgi:hypothetical protein
MANPPQDGVSIDNANDYYPGIDVHYSSGVYNKAFYLLATTSGWDTRKAFDVFVRANQHYWTPSTDFTDGAYGVRDAASDLGYSTAAVEAAFAAVGIDMSPSNLCPDGEHYTGSLTGAGDVNWQPNGTYYFSSLPGMHEGRLTGPANADFDLELYQWNGVAWWKVAESISSTSSESISYFGGYGYYIWRAVSYNGRGNYDFCLHRPAAPGGLASHHTE